MVEISMGQYSCKQQQNKNKKLKKKKKKIIALGQLASDRQIKLL